ncbi:MAG TPA: phosphoenolpyruvate--protein phosphotransferase [Dinghuibacter sp.]|jgi:phosphotransferase system enzyme I (PtsI)|uniref:phosphoenolpyruvate--protein phosphotransferase n=1 Tax=Dinghuibacter sp. TaxID=2024697 RepID=UPI002BD5AB76|nr:phosphoenolpyruvate--protein phosphotransferase [Dinghuibacter sp.]HTJ10884.1 phosphoenolpyruvate--protein phosphotransferase [Dinghuibacter sp.]
MTQIEGIGASPGIAIGKALVIEREERVTRGRLLADPTEIAREIEQYRFAVRRSIAEIRGILDTARPDTDSADILEVQIELLGDPQMERDVVQKISTGMKTAYDATLETVGEITELFHGLEDNYIRERSADIQDMGNRLLRNLEGAAEPALSAEAGTILVAWDLAPSHTLTLDTSRVNGLLTGAGGRTSHAAIIARSRGLAAVVGFGEAIQGITPGDTIILDGETGTVIIDPEPAVLDTYTTRQQAQQAKAALLHALRGKPSVTQDGWAVPLLANVASMADLNLVQAYGGEGVGLLRTELLFMDRDTMPTEEEQFSFYKSIARHTKGKPLTIRTLDLGGDKPLPYLPLPAEENPALGYRAIRVCLREPDIFLPQLKAILRASAWGKVKVLFPMISTVAEVREARALLDEAKRQLTREGVGFNKEIPVGVMIEVPAAAYIADLLAREVDFFSIGTNDLVQYMLAADRMNPRVAGLYDPFHPAVIRLLQFVVQQAQRQLVRVSLCGEMASDPLATLLLIGLGVDELSANPASIPLVKNTVVSHTRSAAQALAKRVLTMDNAAQIRACLEEAIS